MACYIHLLRYLKVSEKGTATIESSIIMPLLVILFVGMVDFGRAFWHYQTVLTGIRDGTRYLSRRPLADPPNSCVLAAGADTEAQTLATTGSIGGGELRLSYFTATSQGAEPIPAGPAHYPCRVWVEATVDIPVLFLDGLGIGPITFTIRDEARHYGN
jgi:hypothetical protein